MLADLYIRYQSLPISSIINGIVAKSGLRLIVATKIPKCLAQHERTSPYD
jgi:hypothetical protein